MANVGIENSAALSSPVYNPRYDSTDIAIYNITQNDSSDETNTALRKQYLNLFYNLPSTNPYEGVLQNPNTCDIDDVNNTANDIVNGLYNNFGNQDAFDSNNPPSQSDPNYENYQYWDQYVNQNNPNSVYSYMTGGIPTTTTYSQDDVLNIPDSATIAVGPDGQYQATTYSQPNNVIPQINYARNHTNTLISNLPMLLSLAQLGLGLASSLENLLNPCLGLSDFFGSISDLGKEMMSEIKKAVNFIKGLIDKGLSYLKTAINDVIGAVLLAVKYIKNLINQVKSEIEKFIKAMIDQIRIGISSFLKSLLGDACAKSLFGGLVTNAAQFAM